MKRNLTLGHSGNGCENIIRAGAHGEHFSYHCSRNFCLDAVSMLREGREAVSSSFGTWRVLLPTVTNFAAFLPFSPAALIFCCTYIAALQKWQNGAPVFQKERLGASRK